ncbi:type IV pilin protein [Francisella adeliensis]|uniref:Prepilin-type N-terminal cleavage/methylation domain-containing protein n=1 Tax=Francisella adeliensis TaxID=2007306 RepID=A0A2Z4XWR9_9GAMM|nr:type IV pilin protein [Francisella adeliensis]AXA33058.1 type IV pili fiber building block protein [Francisella adeliensis]MBK2086054.1 prepilin-type N-terminal cleavage/methylation domain-containing protein [Francisella adeliensis]MBK2096782.1 prepilin-type N-terminal cleavage/methylation domain-containing protein [Francisella adeliensis]QIW11285.1 prepilin-type N-terminal cleavage/methylation domain-containing protein [Francisella adeliensis]QIW13161.1 prepilin-type N-terminal cleavage/me
MQNKKGFSLVELMVVIAIIAILASVGIPMYNNYTLRSHRSEAQAELLSAANAADSFEIRNGEFPSGSDITSFWRSATTQNGFYTLSYCGGGDAACPNIDYEITATAIGSQAADTVCSEMRLEVHGAVTNKTPNSGSSMCWSRG